MNLYFLVEGKTEGKIIPGWLKYLLPDLEQVLSCKEANQNNYFINGNFGFPSILDKIEPSIQDIAETNEYDYLVIWLDADDAGVEKRKREVEKKINLLYHTGIVPDKLHIEIVIPDCCIETWFLGNRALDISPKDPNAEIQSYKTFYNVMEKDPEKMGIDENQKIKTRAQYHLNYLKCLFKTNGFSYNKIRAPRVKEAEYLQELVKRTQQTEHLPTMRKFLDFCQTLAES